MKTRFYVMQVTETGEEFCRADFEDCCAAEWWIDKYHEGYPESRFYVEARG